VRKKADSLGNPAQKSCKKMLSWIRTAFVRSEILWVFARLPPPANSIFTVGRPKLSAMNMTANRARTWSVALLLAALLQHGIFQETRGLLQLGRDLMRRTGAFVIDDRALARLELSLSAFPSSWR
jgi:hypothetical protein